MPRLTGVRPEYNGQRTVWTMPLTWQPPCPAVYTRLADPRSASASQPQRSAGARWILATYQQTTSWVRRFPATASALRSAEQRVVEFVVFCGALMARAPKPHSTNSRAHPTWRRCWMADWPIDQTSSAGSSSWRAARSAHGRSVHELSAAIKAFVESTAARVPELELWAVWIGRSWWSGTRTGTKRQLRAGGPPLVLVTPSLSLFPGENPLLPRPAPRP